MSRNPQLEAVFEARYAWEHSARADRDARLKDYHRLLDEALTRAGSAVATRQELEDALVEAYREFRNANVSRSAPDFRAFADQFHEPARTQIPN